MQQDDCNVGSSAMSADICTLAVQIRRVERSCLFQRLSFVELVGIDGSPVIIPQGGGKAARSPSGFVYVSDGENCPA